MLRSDKNTAKSLLLFSTFPNEHLCSNERKIRNFSKWITDQKKLISPEKKIEGEIEDEKSRNFGECNVTVHNSHFKLFLFGVISSCSRSKNYSSFTVICNSWSLIFLNLFFKRFCNHFAGRDWVWCGAGHRDHLLHPLLYHQAQEWLCPHLRPLQATLQEGTVSRD